MCTLIVNGLLVSLFCTLDQLKCTQNATVWRRILYIFRFQILYIFRFQILYMFRFLLLTAQALALVDCQGICIWLDPSLISWFHYCPQPRPGRKTDHQPFTLDLTLVQMTSPLNAMSNGSVHCFAINVIMLKDWFEHFLSSIFSVDFKLVFAVFVVHGPLLCS